MQDTKLIALVSLLLSTFTIFIAFCIYNQEKATQAWLTAHIPRNATDSNLLLIGGAAESDSEVCDTTCSIANCHMRNTLQDYAAGLKFVAKYVANGRANCAQVGVHKCAADSLQGLGSSEEAATHFHQAIACNESDVQSLAQLSYLYLNVLYQPNETLALLDPYFVRRADAARPPEVVTNRNVACIYMQALMQNQSSVPRVLELLENLRVSKLEFDKCLYVVQHVALMQRRYHADAYQYSKEFVRRHPTFFESHAAMGEALIALGRQTEASAVLNVSFGLLTEQTTPGSSGRFLSKEFQQGIRWRLADALYACDAMAKALFIYNEIIEGNPSLEQSKRCTLLTKVGKIHHSKQEYHKAYVALLQSTSACRVDLSGWLLLGKVQHQLGLLHDASESFQRAATNKALMAEASAALLAVKATVQEGMRRDAAAAEAKLGPKPPDDPNIVRRQPNGTFVEFLARQEKEKLKKAEGEAHKVQMEHSKPGASVNASQLPVTGLNDMEAAKNAVPPTSTGTPVAPANDAPQLSTVQTEPAASAAVADSGSIVHSSAPHALGPSALNNEEDLALSPAGFGTVSSAVMEESVNPSVAFPQDKASDTPVDVGATLLSATETAARQVADQYIIMARAYLERKDTDQALKQLGKAIKRAPAYPESYLVRGSVHLAAGHMTKAVEDFLKVFTDLDPANSIAASALYKVASDLALQGQMVSAMQLFASTNTTLPRDEEFSLSLAVTLGNQGDYERALSVLDSILPQSPSTARRVGLYAQLYELQGDLNNAERVLSEAAAERLLPWNEVGEWHLQHESLARAVAAFERHLEALPLGTAAAQRAVVHKQIGSLYSRMYDALSTSSARSSLDIPGETTEHDQDFLLKALQHFLEAMKGGIYDVETRKFFARHPHLSERGETNGSVIKAQPAGDSFDTSANHDLPEGASVVGATEDGQNEQEDTLRDLLCVEPCSAMDKTRDSLDTPPTSVKSLGGMNHLHTHAKAAAGAGVGPAEDSIPTTASIAAASGVLHSRRSRWVVRQLPVPAAPSAAADHSDTVAAPADSVGPTLGDIHGRGDSHPKYSNQLSDLEHELLGQQSVGVEAALQSGIAEYDLLHGPHEAQQQVEEEVAETILLL